MKFTKPNIAAIYTFIKAYDRHLAHLKDAVCFQPGHFCSGRASDGGTPMECSPVSCGNHISIYPCMNYLDPVVVETHFEQTDDGIFWKITKREKRSDPEITVMRGVFRDRLLVTETPCPGRVREGMMKVALLAEKFAKMEHEAMHL